MCYIITVIDDNIVSFGNWTIIVDAKLILENCRVFAVDKSRLNTLRKREETAAIKGKVNNSFILEKMKILVSE